MYDNPMQLISMIQNSGNPMAMIRHIAGTNPAMARTLQMLQGKNENQMRETIRNVAKQRGISDEELSQMANQLGIKL